MGFEVRAALVGDLAGVAGVAVVTAQSTEGSAADPRYAAHLLTSGRLVVAVEVDRIVGYAGSMVIGAADQLTDLFVDPSREGIGVGRALLDQVWSGAPDRMTFSSSHPRALPLYVRAGLTPFWPLVYLRGRPSTLPTPVRSQSVDDVSPETATAVEQELGGADRRADYGYWAARPNARLLVVRDAGLAVGVGAIGGVGQDASLSHLRVRSAENAADALTRVLQVFEGDVGVAIPGPSPALSVFLSSGWRVVDVDQFLATSPDLIDPTLVFPHPGLA